MLVVGDAVAHVRGLVVSWSRRHRRDHLAPRLAHEHDLEEEFLQRATQLQLLLCQCLLIMLTGQTQTCRRFYTIERLKSFVYTIAI